MIRAVYASDTDSEAILGALDELVPATCTEDIEFIEMPDRVDSRTYRGHEEVKQAFRRFYEQWQQHSVELVDAEDHGDQVFVTLREHATGKGSGIELSQLLYIVNDFRDGKVCRYFESYDEATARAELRD